MNRKVWALFTAVLVAVVAWGAYLAHAEAILGKVGVEPSTLAIAAVAIIFIALFTGPIGDRRFVWITRFSYVFTIAALLASVLPFVLLEERDFNGGALGIAVGCVEGNSEDRELPSEILCDGKDGTEHRFWLVNIGGAPAPAEQSANGRGETASGRITGGLVIPLYVLVLALMGAAVSMTRRVPEYQMRVAEANGHTRKKELNGRSKREPISFARARELMVFQIMQVVSAPMIALTAYYLILPDTRTTSVIIAFVSGFASETILRLLRIAADGLTEKLDTAKSGARA